MLQAIVRMLKIIWEMLWLAVWALQIDYINTSTEKKDFGIWKHFQKCNAIGYLVPLEWVTEPA